MKFIQTLRRTYGSFFIASLFIFYFGLKGFAASLAGAAMLPLFMSRYKVGVADFQAFMVAVMTPWSLKPIIGILSDIVPIRGENKRPYMFGACIIGTVCYAALAIYTECTDLSPLIAAVFLTGISLETATIDLLAEGKYAERMRGSPESGGALPSFVWASMFAGSLVAASIAGPLADSGQIRAIFVLGVPAAAFVLVPLLLKWFPDDVNVSGGWTKLQANNSANLRLGVLAIIMAVASCTLTGVTLSKESAKVKLATAVGLSVVLCVSGHVFLPARISRCNLYMFLASVLHISLAGALDYFYTAPKSCIGDAPHFSMTFFVTWSQVAGSAASLAAVFLFQGCMQSWSLRSLFWVSTVVRCAAAGVDLLIVNRINVKAGVPDKVAYMLGNNVAASVATQFDLMPAVVLTSKLCLPGMEATVYAILAGFQNFGGSVSAAIGSALTTEFGIHADLTTGECNFDGLTTLIVVGHVLLPLLTVPLTFILIPDVKLTENVIH